MGFVTFKLDIFKRILFATVEFITENAAFVELLKFGILGYLKDQ
jgi:hypothetical protein